MSPCSEVASKVVLYQSPIVPHFVPEYIVFVLRKSKVDSISLGTVSDFFFPSQERVQKTTSLLKYSIFLEREMESTFDFLNTGTYVGLILQRNNSELRFTKIIKKKALTAS